MPKRRANGEGNIRKRKDGRWEGRYTVGHDPETGKAIIKNVLGKTQAEVKEKLKKAIEENVGIDYGRAKTYTVGSWLEVWMENYAKIKLRPSTFKTSQGFLKNHIKPQIGSVPLAELTSLDLQRFYKIRDCNGSSAQCAENPAYRVLLFAFHAEYGQFCRGHSPQPPIGKSAVLPVQSPCPQ